MAEYNIKIAKSIRQIVLSQVQSIPEELFDIQPPQFNNTIRWQVGHIVTSLDSLLSLAVPFNSNLPETYAALFQTGTKPADWTSTPPDKAELTKYLTKQLEQIEKVPTESFAEALKNPVELGPLRFETVGEMFHFTFIHEAIHQGNIASILKVIQHEQQ